jgi:hypothetical protein
MNNPLKNDDIYKILSESFGQLNEQESDDDDFGLENVPVSRTGGPGGRLGAPKGDPAKSAGPVSDKSTTDDPRSPQTGTTVQTSAGRDAGERSTDFDSSGSGEKVTPELDAKPDPAAPEASEEAPEGTAGVPGQAGVFTAEDFMVPEGAFSSKISTLNAKIQTKNGMLTIINRGISPNADIMDENPDIVYTIVSEKDGQEKRKNVNVPYSVVRDGKREEHFAVVLDHIRGIHPYDDTAIAGPTPPDISGGNPQ